MPLKKSQKSLKNWSKQKWRTKSGKPSAKTGERYLPEKAIKSMSSQEYAATTRKNARILKQVNSFLLSLKRLQRKPDVLGEYNA